MECHRLAQAFLEAEKRFNPGLPGIIWESARDSTLVRDIMKRLKNPPLYPPEPEWKEKLRAIKREIANVPQIHLSGMKGQEGVWWVNRPGLFTKIDRILEEK